MENMGHADGVPMECEGKGRGKQMAAVEHWSPAWSIHGPLNTH
jgi:hypothetical protein